MFLLLRNTALRAINPCSRRTRMQSILKFLLLLTLGTAIPVFAAPLVPPSIAAGFINTANQTSAMGTNLAAPTDYGREYPFINYFKMARPWFSAPADGSAFQDERALDLDARGNVRSLAAGQVARSVLFTGAPADPGIAGRTFNLYFDGDGDFEVSNAAPGSFQQISARHYRFATRDITGPDDELILIITMTRNNPQQPVRNVRLMPGGGICASNPMLRVSSATNCPGGDFLSFRAAHATIVFNPEFLAQIKSYRSLRFMDWMKTNNSLTTRFSTRPLPEDQFWNADDATFNDCNMLRPGRCKGVPLEVMFALANLMDMNPWFNIPHRATITDTDTATSYVTEFARMVNESLEPGRHAYIEYSNEVWNGQFTQTAFATNQAGANLARYGTNRFAENDPGSAFVRFYSDRAQLIFRRFAAEMDDMNRIRRVMASQAVNPFLTEEILAFRKGADLTDHFAIAPYFGDTISEGETFFLECSDFRAAESPITRRDAIVQAGVDGVFAWLNGDPGAPDLGYGSLPCVRAAMLAQRTSARKFGVALGVYEGGQHFLAAGSLRFGDPELNAIMDAVNRDPRMKQVYLSYLAQWRGASTIVGIAPEGNVFHHFLNSDMWTPFGRWGAKEFPTQSPAQAPKFDALMTYIARRPLATVP
jgi:hypothetical protein